MNVSITRCDSYDSAQLDEALRALLAPLGGMEAFVCPGSRVYIKPNMVERALPEAATVTHPALIGAVARLAVEAGGEVVVGDCPGAVFGPKETEEIYRFTGMKQAVEQAGARTIINQESLRRPLSTGWSIDHFEMAREMAQCDVLINLPKLKTHTFTGLSGAVKNLYGVICGMTKVAYHGRFPAREDFSAFLVDVAENVKPALNIVDAVVCHEGQGPTGGTPRPAYALLASADIHALDYACVQIMGLRPFDMPTLKKAKEFGLLDERDIGYPLQSPKEFAGRAFKPAVRSIPFLPNIRKIIPLKIRRRFRVRPLVKPEACVGCGICKKACPASAVRIENKLAVIDRDLCQFCFCCQELCPRKAIEAKRKIRGT